MAGFVFLRVRAHRLLLAAALLTVLLTTAVLATLGAFSAAIGDAGLRHALRERSAAPAALRVATDLPESERAAAERAVRRGAERTFDGLPVTLRSMARSGPYALPRELQSAAARQGEPDLTLFAAMDRTRVTLTTGAWPNGAPQEPGKSGKSAANGKDGKGDKGDKAAAALPVALPETAAARLGLRVGADLTLTDRLSGPPVRILITGLYRPKDRTDPYWQLDDLGGSGVRTLAFTTYGPLLTDDAAFRDERVAQAGMSWLATADFSGVSADDVDGLRSAAERGRAALAKDPALGGPEVSTGLPTVLDQADRSLLGARSTLLIVTLQLVLLAGYALLLVARLLSTERAGETELLLARGASGPRIARLAAIEALLLAGPAAVAAPLLAGPLMELIAAYGPLARVGLDLDTGLTWQTCVIGGAVALGCAAAVVAPALLGARARGGPSVVRARASALPAPLRAGADVGLLVIAGVAYWQLDQQSDDGGGVLSGDGGALGVDPVLVAAPALALLAGTVLTLRLLPPVARIAERRAARGRGLPTALAGWQLARRPLRGAGPVLLLVLAVAMGMFAVGQGASWERSQDDQADFAAGTDVRVLSSRIPQLGQGGAYASVPGVAAAAPAARVQFGLSGGRGASLLALDARHAKGSLLMREDLADRDAQAVLDTVAPREAVERPGIALPGTPDELRLTARLGAPDAPGGTSPSKASAAVTVTIEDRFGVPYPLRIGQLPVDGKPRTLVAGIARTAGAPGGKPAGPLRLTSIKLDLLQSARAERHAFEVSELRAVGADGAAEAVPVPDGFDWRATATFAEEEPGNVRARPRAERPRHTADRPLTAGYDTGHHVGDDLIPSRPTSTFTFAAPWPRQPGPLTAVATDRFLDSSGAKVGSTVSVPVAGETLPVRVVAAVRALPTTGAAAERTSGAATAAGDDQGAADAAATGGSTSDGGALLVDFRAVNQALAARDSAALPPSEWWLRPAPGKGEQVVAALRQRPDTDPAQVIARSEIADDLHDDPFGAGPQAGLAAAALVAAALAAVGFAVSMAGSLRERAAEFGVLRALGAPRRQLARMVAAEQALLISLALAVGLALGTVLTRAVVPLIVLTGEAAQPVPEVLVELPLWQVGGVLAAVAAVPVLIVAAVALRRGDPVATLRHRGGE
ncbi:ABC transporter permease [Streptomyces sp. 71268]|uniref:ABC transporter permease n=1 Tax=Streptomyces sp. 71268 TaxID=3002640 RepID=UPI0023F6DB35|nr:ABC transporter permease [Streptomyces sp. 71268]WEV27809.1 ABC transporter permease [Streptomyces sp. 71268]